MLSGVKFSANSDYSLLLYLVFTLLDLAKENLEGSAPAPSQQVLLSTAQLWPIRRRGHRFSFSCLDFAFELNPCIIQASGSFFSVIQSNLSDSLLLDTISPATSRIMPLLKSKPQCLFATYRRDINSEMRVLVLPHLPSDFCLFSSHLFSFCLFCFAGFFGNFS